LTHRQIERGRERATHRGRQRQRDTDRQRKGQRETDCDNETGRERGREKERQRQTEKGTERNRDRLTEKGTERSRDTDRQRKGQRETDKTENNRQAGHNFAFMPRLAMQTFKPEFGPYTFSMTPSSAFMLLYVQHLLLHWSMSIYTLRNTAYGQTTATARPPATRNARQTPVVSWSAVCGVSLTRVWSRDQQQSGRVSIDDVTSPTLWGFLASVHCTQQKEPSDIVIPA